MASPGKKAFLLRLDPQVWAALERLGFTVRAVPQSQGTPFANVLLVADLQGASA